VPRPDGRDESFRVAGPPWQPEPQYVDRLRGGDGPQAGALPDAGEAPVGPDGEQGPHLVPAVGAAVAHAPHEPVLLDQLAHVGPQHQLEGRGACRLGHEERQEVCLAHDGDEWEARAEAAEFQAGRGLGGDGDRPELPVRHRRQQPVGDADGVQDLQDGRVHRVAAEVAVEVAVGLEQDDADPLAGQEQGEHRAGGARAHDAAGRQAHVAGRRRPRRRGPLLGLRRPRALAVRLHSDHAPIKEPRGGP
jgi:hypothetical protein